MNVFNMKNCSAIPLEFKVLIVLRILARGNDFDTISELSLVPLSTCHRIFVTFIKSFVVNFFDKYVYFPTGDKLRECMNTYKLLGFNGCVGSFDCTHIYWNKCPKELVNYCVGKEKKPTVSFQCVVDHNRRVQMCSLPYCRATSDKLIFKDDK